MPMPQLEQQRAVHLALHERGFSLQHGDKSILQYPAHYSNRQLC
jgi:hypothetical protein